MASFEGQATGATGESSGFATGGLVGKLEYLSLVEKSWSSGNVNGNYMVGGLVGQTHLAVWPTIILEQM